MNLTVNGTVRPSLRTRKLKYFSFADVDAEAAEKTAAHCRDVMDELVRMCWSVVRRFCVPVAVHRLRP